MHFMKITYGVSRVSSHAVLTSQRSQLIAHSNSLLAGKQKDVKMTLAADLDIKFDNCEKMQNTLSVLAKSFQLFKPNELLLCYNGGKDCTVILDLLDKYCTKFNIERIGSLYIQSADPFDEVEAFVHKSVKYYNTTVHKYAGTQKSALEALVKDMPHLRGVIMGCRHSDPHCSKLTSMVPTDSDWPPLMRIFPLLEWSYHDIWRYLIENKVAYCELYDRGYSSLGEKSNTAVNPSLMCYDTTKQEYKFRPAHELTDVHTERISRKLHKTGNNED